MIFICRRLPFKNYPILPHLRLTNLTMNTRKHNNDFCLFVKVAREFDTVVSYMGCLLKRCNQTIDHLSYTYSGESPYYIATITIIPRSNNY